MTAVPLPASADPAHLSRGPHLDAGALARVMPFYLHLDAHQRVLGCGPALAKACPAAVPGAALVEVFDTELPLDLQAERVRLTARQRAPLVLCGEALAQADGSRLLILRADLHHTQEMAALGLGLDDLPPHDATAELMLVRRSGQLAQQGLRDALDQAQHQCDDHAAMLQLAAGGVLYFDPQGRLGHCNAALENILELPCAELAGLPLARMDEVLCSNMVGIEPLPRVLEQLAEEVLRPVAQRYGNLLQPGWVPAEMPTRTVQLTLPDRKFVRIGARAGRDGAVIFCFTDITRETEIDRMKSDFLATAAHELRSPMVSVIGFTELLLTRTYAPEKQRDMLGTVHRQRGKAKAAGVGRGGEADRAAALGAGTRVGHRGQRHAGREVVSHRATAQRIRAVQHRELHRDDVAAIDGGGGRLGATDRAGDLRKEILRQRGSSLSGCRGQHGQRHQAGTEGRLRPPLQPSPHTTRVTTHRCSGPLLDRRHAWLSLSSVVHPQPAQAKVRDDAKGHQQGKRTRATDLRAQKITCGRRAGGLFTFVSFG